MNGDTQAAETNELPTGGSLPNSNELNIPQRIVELEKRARDVSKEFDKLEKNQDKVSNFMMWMTGIIAGVFFVTGILVAFDYFVRNEERYEKFVERTQDYYTKTEVDRSINFSAGQYEKELSDFKSCLNSGRWSVCFK